LHPIKFTVRNTEPDQCLDYFQLKRAVYKTSGMNIRIKLGIYAHITVTM